MHVKAYWGFQFLQNTFEKKKQRAILISEPVCGIHILVFMEEKKTYNVWGSLYSNFELFTDAWCIHTSAASATTRSRNFSDRKNKLATTVALMTRSTIPWKQKLRIIPDNLTRPCSTTKVAINTTSILKTELRAYISHLNVAWVNMGLIASMVFHKKLA